MTDQSPLVRLHGASFGYTDRPVVSGVDLELHAREVVALLGPNGSGKSTLVRGILGLTAQQGGDVELFGTPRDRFTEHTRIGYVPQRHSLSASVRATVTEIVEVGPAPAPAVVEARDPRATGPSSARRSPTSASPTGRTRRWRRSPVGSSAGCSSPGRSPGGPSCSSWTSRPPASTTPARRRSPTCCTASPTAAPRCSSSRTSSRRSRPSSAASSACDAGHVDFDGDPAAYAAHLRRPRRRLGPPPRRPTRHAQRPRHRRGPARPGTPGGGAVNELLALDFMRQALLAALLAGFAAPLVGVFLVQRRMSLIGDGMGHVALAGVAVGVLTDQAPVLTALVAAVAGRGRHRADPGLRAHQRRHRAGRDVLRRHRPRRRPHRTVERRHARRRSPATCSGRSSRRPPATSSSSRCWQPWCSRRRSCCARASSPSPTTRSSPARSGCRCSATTSCSRCSPRSPWWCRCALSGCC